jgi:uncharacterized protein YbaR (Trm112 family)
VICATLLPATAEGIMATHLEAEKPLVKRPERRIEASSALPSAADLDGDAEEKAMAVATIDGMPEASADTNHKGKTYMESLICPICKRQLSDGGSTTPGPRELAGSVPIETLYCASCEMLVAPLASSVPRVSVNASDNHGRIRSGVSNAGGSQRGDASDHGASQWRTDPREAERNTWQDKD